MTTENNFFNLLIEISEKLNRMETVQKTDIMQIRASISSVAQYITDSRENLDYGDIIEKLEELSYKTESANNTLAKDLYGDISSLKEIARANEKNILALQTNQRDTLKAEDFEEFQRQQINVTTKNNENILEYVKNIKSSFDNISEQLSNIEELQNSDLTGAKFTAVERALEETNDAVIKELSFIKTTAQGIRDIQDSLLTEEDLEYIKNDFETVKKAIEDIRNTQNSIFSNKDGETLYSELKAVKSIISEIQVKQSDSLTSEQYVTFEKKILEESSRLNENLLTELQTIKNTANSVNNTQEENITSIKERLEELHLNLKRYAEQLLNKSEVIPTLSDIGVVITDMGNMQQKDIRQTAKMIQDVHASLADMKSDFGNKEFVAQINKISEIYNVIQMIYNWVEKVGYVNQAVENVYARLGENIDFDDVSEKIDIVYENVSALNTWSKKIDEIKTSADDIRNTLQMLNAFKQDSADTLNLLNSIKSQIETTFASEPDFEDITNKIDIIYENIFTFNTTFSKIDEIKNTATLINDKFSDIYSLKIGLADISANIEKIKNKLNDKNASDTRLEGIIAQIGDLTANMSELSNSVKDGDIVRRLNLLALKTDELIKSDDIAYLSDKLDAIPTSAKLKQAKDDISAGLASIMNKLNDLSRVDEVLSRLDEISEKNDSSAIVDDIKALRENVKVLTDNTDLMANEIFNSAVNDKIDALSCTIGELSKSIDKEMIFSKIDLIYENIGLLNDWVIKIDALSENAREAEFKRNKISEEFSSKTDEISAAIAKLSENNEYISDIKDKLDLLANELHTITSKTKNESETYIYTLPDIESDLIKVNKGLNENRNETKKQIEELKDCFADVTEDIASISIRTNKLILSADDANKEFKKSLEVLNGAIRILDEKSKTLNSDEKFDILHVKLAGIYEIMQQSVNSGRNFQSAFEYLGEWADNAGKLLKELESDVSSVKTEQLKALNDKINKLIEESAIQTNNTNLIAKGIESFEAGISQILDNTRETFALTRGVNNISNAAKTVLKQNQLSLNDIASVKTEISDISKQLDAIKENAAQISELKEIIKDVSGIKTLEKQLNVLEDEFSLFKNNDVSEIKSLMSGITLQLGTVSAPDVNKLNAEIEKICELEAKMTEKTDNQEKRIAVLEEKLDKITAKLDGISDALIKKTSKDSEFNEILKFVASQLETNNNNARIIKDVAGKLEVMGASIDKVASYIDEE